MADGWCIGVRMNRAVQQCDKRKKVTIAPEDIIEALKEAEFEDFEGPLKASLDAFQNASKAAKTAKASSAKRQKLDESVVDDGAFPPSLSSRVARRCARGCTLIDVRTFASGLPRAPVTRQVRATGSSRPARRQARTRSPPPRSCHLFSLYLLQRHLGAQRFWGRGVYAISSSAPS